MIRFVSLSSIRAARAARWLPLVIAIVVGCHKSSSTSPTVAAETSGTLIVTVAPPVTTLVDITVLGPAGLNLLLAGTDTLVALGAGTYTVSAASAVSSDEVVSTVYTGVVTGSPVAVTIGDTSRTSVAFTPRPGTGGLWVASSNGGSPIAAQFTSGALRAGQSAGVTLSVPDASAVFDATGDLWIANHSGNTLTEYPSSGLATSGTPAATVTITGSSLNGPDGMAFDPSGNLWVSNSTGNTVVEYTPEQLGSSGSPAPTLTISGSGLSGPARLSFDVYGNLWIPNAGSNTVVQYSAAQLLVGGALTPAITFAATSGSLDAPQALAFDTEGNLWVANLSNGSIVEYGPGQLLTGGAATPVATLTVAGGGVSFTALAFDNSGDLWTTSASTAQVLEFTGRQVVAAGSQSPGVALAVGAGPNSLAFNPAPDGLPIVSPSTARIARDRGHLHHH
jgi:sugar lactone lactonase YvrE